MPPPGSQQQQLISDHNFKLSIPGLTIGTFKYCHGLMMSFEVFEWAEGGNNEFVHQLPGRLKYSPLMLQAGLTEDDAVQQWFWATRQQAQLKDITIELYSQDNSKRRAWTFADAYPVRWTGPRIAADSRGLSTESLEIAHSGLKMG